MLLVIGKKEYKKLFWKCWKNLKSLINLKYNWILEFVVALEWTYLNNQNKRKY
jgi:hypothetical protein